MDNEEKYTSIIYAFIELFISPLMSTYSKKLFKIKKDMSCIFVI